MVEDFSSFFEQLEAHARNDQQARAFENSSTDESPLTLSEEQLAELKSDLSTFDEPNNETATR